MASSNHLTGSTQSELNKSHKVAATTVRGLLIATILLSIVAYLGQSFFPQQQNPPLDIGLRIAILIFGLGSIALRRTRFAAMRLQDIGALKGASGLLHTLERTTLQLALIAASIATMGFIGTVMTGDARYTYVSGVIALAVLVYCYPIRSSWERTLQQFAQNSNEIAPPSN